MDDTFFKRIRNHTNAVEQAGSKSNAAGIRQDLLIALRTSAIRDRADINNWHSLETQGVRSTWRSNSAIQRESKQIRRTSK